MAKSLLEKYPDLDATPRPQGRIESLHKKVRQQQAAKQKARHDEVLTESRMEKRVRRALNVNWPEYVHDAGGNVIGVQERGKAKGASIQSDKRDETGKRDYDFWPLGRHEHVVTEDAGAAV